MSNFAKAWKEIREAKTLTERTYFISPLLFGFLKDVSVIIGLDRRRSASSNEEMTRRINERNSKVLGLLGVEGGSISVKSGPFSGMKYTVSSAGSVLGPKIFGVYENEINEWIEEIASHDKYDIIIDVGCAEGYYATGFAYRCRRARVYAYDIDPRAQELAASLTRANGVENRVIIAGLCSSDELQARLTTAEHALVFVDIEGGEDELLDPKLIPGLRSADIIVELHEHKRPGLTYRLLDRFAATHRVEIVAATPDEWKLQLISDQTPEILEFISEGRRVPQLWLRLSTRVSPFSIESKKILESGQV